MSFGKVFIATTLDGFIARRDGSIDWLEGYGGGEEDYGYAAFMEGVDGIVMGRNTFEKVLTYGGWPYRKPVVVMSRTLSAHGLPDTVGSQVEISRQTPQALVTSLRDRGWRSAYVDGGRLIQAFLTAGLIGEMTITRVPVVIGDGLPLFAPLGRDIALSAKETRAFRDGLVSTAYQVRG